MPSSTTSLQVISCHSAVCDESVMKSFFSSVKLFMLIPMLPSKSMLFVWRLLYPLCGQMKVLYFKSLGIMLIFLWLRLTFFFKWVPFVL